MGDAGHHGFLVKKCEPPKEIEESIGKENLAIEGMVDIFFDTDRDYRPENESNLCCIYSCADPDEEAISFLEAMIESAKEEIKKLKEMSKGG